MRRAVGRLGVAAGVGLVLLCVWVLFSGASDLRRQGIAALGLLLAVAMVALGLKTIREGRFEDPEVLEARLLTLGRHAEGRLRLREAMSELSLSRDRIERALAALEARGLCERESPGLYRFPAFTGLAEPDEEGDEEEVA